MTKDEQLEVLRTLDKLPLNQAKNIALEILNSIQLPPMTDSRLSSTKKRAKVNKLVYQIKNYNSTAQVCSTMWNLEQALGGYRIINSSWDNHYKGI